MYNKFVHALLLQSSAFGTMRLFHCGPVPVCSITNAYQNTTASNAGVSLKSSRFVKWNQFLNKGKRKLNVASKDNFRRSDVKWRTRDLSVLWISLDFTMKKEPEAILDGEIDRRLVYLMYLAIKRQNHRISPRVVYSRAMLKAVKTPLSNKNASV